MSDDWPDVWQWGPAFRRLVDDIALLAWLFEEDRHARMGSGVAVAGSVDDVEHAAAGALVGGGESESGHRSCCGCCGEKGEAAAD